MAEGLPKKVAAFMAQNPPPPFEVLPCNRQAFDLFVYMSTQWHAGMNGATGLIYAEAYKRLDELGIVRRKKRLALIESLRVMESEALKAMGERRGQ